MVIRLKEQGLSRFWRISTSSLFLLFLMLVVVALGKGAWNMYLKSEEAAEGRAEVEKRLSELKERERFLSRGTELLKTPAGLERAVRETFNVSKEGERVYIIVDNMLASTSPDQSVAESVLRWFKGLFQKRD